MKHNPFCCKELVLFMLIGIIFVTFSCKNEVKEEVFEQKLIAKLELTEQELYNKVLGMIVGSAYGDAMGAPTEMWSRDFIQSEYGYVEDLDSMVREVSPEGIWKANLSAGGTTDDTRWKELTIKYLLTQKQPSLSSKDFAKSIIDNYSDAIDQYGKIKSKYPEPYEENTLKVAWLQEWAKVAFPYVDNKLDEYQIALSKFYGGEMVCAGLLYSPMIGAFFPNQPDKSYEEAFKINIFDIGYARDISSLSASITSAAMKKNATKEDLLGIFRSVDPQNYFGSRLVSRTSYKIYRKAVFLANEARKVSENSENAAFVSLDQNLQDMPFHAGEIHLQVLTAMIFSDFDFKKTLQFLVNYGRDNDTTAAVAGAILGAFHGYDLLPDDKIRVIKTTKEDLNIDLEHLAKQLTWHIINLQKG